MTERPAYRALDIAPGQRYFDCTALRASLSSAACAQRWDAAAPGSSCHGCALGRLHAADHAPSKRPGRRPVDNEVRACTRCGRSDLRIVKADCVCVSCFNREAEWRKGRNGRGTPPARFTPLRPVEVAIQRQSGAIERHLLEARDEAEAVARIAHVLPEGVRLIDTPRPGRTAWNAATGTFEYTCSRCGTQGTLLERVRAGKLERHSWCCAGEPTGQGWRVAVVRQPIFSMDVDAVSAVLNGDPELAGDEPCLWTPTPHPCAACHSGQIEARSLAPGGRWQCRCASCGASSK
ncbi:hypothetical protein ABIA94_005039 [Bradyrhizobium sp. LA7.1]